MNLFHAHRAYAILTCMTRARMRGREGWYFIVRTHRITNVRRFVIYALFRVDAHLGYRAGSPQDYVAAFLIMIMRTGPTYGYNEQRVE